MDFSTKSIKLCVLLAVLIKGEKDGSELYSPEIEQAQSAEELGRNTTRFASRLWTEQVVTTLTDFRVEATLIRDSVEDKWNGGIMLDDCMQKATRDLKEIDTLYKETETACVKSSNEKVNVYKKQSKDATKELRRWRQSVQYIRKNCVREYPEDQNLALQCYLRQVKSLHYDTEFLILMSTFVDAQEAVTSQLEAAKEDLRKCLQNALDDFRVAVNNMNVNLTLCQENNTIASVKK